MCPINMTVSHAHTQTLPLQQVGVGERGGRGWGVWGLVPSSRAWTPSSSFSPLHSVLSSRCQEVAQCLFFFFLLKGLHDFTRLFFIFVLQSWEEQTGSQRVSGRFVCLCFILSPVPWLSLIRSSGSSWSVVTKTTHTQGTVYGRIRDTWGEEEKKKIGFRFHYV